MNISDNLPLWGINVEETKDKIVISSDYYQIHFDKRRGYFSVNTYKSVIQNAVAEIVLEDGRIFSTSDSDYIRNLEWIKREDDEYIVSILCVSKSNNFDIRLLFSLKKDGIFIKNYLQVINKQNQTIAIKKLNPLVLRSKKGGALFIGRNPSLHRILENGSHGFLDFYS